MLSDREIPTVVKLSPAEVLVLIDARDGTALNRYIRELAWDAWEEHLEQAYGCQDFSSWDRYHTWLMKRWRGDRDNPLYHL